MARGGERELIRMGAGGGAEAFFFFCLCVVLRCAGRGGACSLCLLKLCGNFETTPPF